MRRQIIISPDLIDEVALVRSREVGSDMGAVVNFLGCVRGQETGNEIAALEYEAFEPMARHQFNLLLDQVEKRWPISSVRLVHRLGRVAVGEPSLWVEVVAPHRAEAFAAAQFLIDEMKRTVPIWKKPVASAVFPS
ncbi:MAG TPA: molybdenum cofactor biosynthesis protein MoaE [Verrucomicrobiae bacterium]|jgi:molybdopterin synthase catalytic subunit|nr:molybdenum cofactor biosynthesis protein MoaE [Verrucomicrobiae bacterium]